MKGILGRKIGMTSVFAEHGRNINVTVIEAIPNIVSHVLTNEKDGYNALQLSILDKRNKTISKSVLGHLKKAKTNAKHFIKEIKGMTGFNLGDKVDLSIFKVGQLVDVSGTTKGKGFAGSIKRHNQKIGPKSHGGAGGSKPSRLTGSIGDVVSNRVFKGTNMPGNMGHTKNTLQNLEIILVDIKNHLLLVKGSIPGPKKSFVIIKNAIKKINTKEPVKLVFYEKSENKIKIEKDKKSTIKIDTKKENETVNKVNTSKKINKPIENKIKIEKDKKSNIKIDTKKENETVNKVNTSKKINKPIENKIKIEKDKKSTIKIDTKKENETVNKVNTSKKINKPIENKIKNKDEGK